MSEQEPTGGIADVMALDARSDDFAADTVEAYEALSQRVKALEGQIKALLDLFEHSANRTWDAFEEVTDMMKTLSAAITTVGRRTP